jgi:hypothetical protein
MTYPSENVRQRKKVKKMQKKKKNQTQKSFHTAHHGLSGIWGPMVRGFNLTGTNGMTQSTEKKTSATNKDYTIKMEGKKKYTQSTIEKKQTLQREIPTKINS